MYCYAVVAGMVAGKGLGGIANAVLQIAGVSGAFRGTVVGCPLTSIVDDEKNDRNTNTVDSGDGKDTAELIYINVQ